MYAEKPNPNDPGYSQHLKKVMRKIKRIMDRYNVAGSATVYEPGFSEYLAVIDPIFSRIKFGQKPGQLVIMDDINDFKGDETARLEALEATMNMLVHLANMSRLMFQNFNNMANDIEKRALYKLPGEKKAQTTEEMMASVKKVDAPVKDVPAPSKAKATEDDHLRAVIYALLQDPNTKDVDPYRVETAMKKLLERDHSLLNGILAIMEGSLGIEFKKPDNRENPCPKCETGELIETGHTPRANEMATHYECNECGHTATFP